MVTEQPIVAFLYDFDKTLCTTDMQDYAFIPSLGMTPAEFWAEANDFGRRHRIDGILAYMYTMIREAERKHLPFTRADLVDRIWTDGAEYVDENALSVTVKRLRDKLEDTPSKPQYLKTVYGVGYTWAVV